MSKKTEKNNEQSNEQGIFKNEVSYRLSKWMLLNMEGDGILTAELFRLALENILKYFDPPLGLENLDWPIGDGGTVDQKSGVKSHFGSRIICGECGLKYGPRLTHSTTLSQIVWQCWGRNDDLMHCKAPYIYDKLLRYSVHKIAMIIIYDRDIEWTLLDALKPLFRDEKVKEIQEWLTEFRFRDIWDLQSDEDDFTLIIQEIVVMGDKRAEIYLYDGDVYKYRFPEFRPSRYREINDQPVEMTKAS